MPKVSIAESLVDLEGLVTSVEALPLEDDVLGGQLDELRTLVVQAKELYVLRNRLEGERRAAGQALAETTDQAQRIGSRIRSKLKGVFGHTNSQLLGFGIKPRPLARGAAPREPYPAAFKKK